MNNNYVLVTKENIDQFTNNEYIKKYVIGKIESGQTIIVSHQFLRKYVCSCTIGIYSAFQRI